MSERSGESGGITSGDPLGGYTSPPPPGAGGPVAPAFGAEPALGGRYVLASWWARVGAQIVDGIIIGVGAVILFLPVGAAFGLGASADSDAGLWTAVGGLVLWVICVSLIALLYAPVMMSRTNGKTLGRMVTNIRVVRTSGEPITFWFAVMREVLIKTVIFGLAGSVTAGIAPLLDVLWPLWDEENRALHDYIAGTRVVQG